MRKIIYSGPEEGLFVMGPFYHYMKKLGARDIDGSGRQDPEFSLILTTGVRVDFLYRSLDQKGPITVLASGSEENIGELEKVINEEVKIRPKIKPAEIFR